MKTSAEITTALLIDLILAQADLIRTFAEEIEHLPVSFITTPENEERFNRLIEVNRLAIIRDCLIDDDGKLRTFDVSESSPPFSKQ